MSQRANAGIIQAQSQGDDPLFHYTRLFVRFLQLVFGTFDEGSYRWNSDDNSTDILITGQAHISREAAEKSPAIIVTRGQMNFGNLSLDQFKKFDPLTGKRTHADLSSASVVYNCISHEGAEASRIASIASYATRVLKRTLMAAGIHRVGEEIALSSESPPGALIQGDPTEAILVSVSVPFYFPQTWTIEPVDKVLLKDLSLVLRSDVNFPADGASINPPSLNGRPISYSSLVSLTQTGRVAGTPKSRK